MKAPRMSFSERRRRMLARKVDRLDRLETRSTITEPISIVGLSVSALGGAARLGIIYPNGASNAPNGLMRRDLPSGQGQLDAKRAPVASQVSASAALAPHPKQPAGAGGGGAVQELTSRPSGAGHSQPGNVLSLLSSTDSNPSQSHGISTPWKPASGTAGGAAMAPRGGSGGPTPTRAAAHRASTSASLPASTPGASSGNAAAPLAAVAGAAGGNAGGTGHPSGSPGHATASGSPTSRRPRRKHRRWCERPARYHRRVVGHLNLRRLAGPGIGTLFPHEQRLGAIAGNVSLLSRSTCST